MRREKKKRITPVKTNKQAEVKYRRQLEILVKKLRSDVASQIVPLLKILESEYVSDGYAQTLEEAFDNLRKSYIGIAANAKIAANTFTNDTDQANKKRFYKSIEKAVGVDLGSIVQSEDLTNVLVATTRENVNLIRSIPEEYFKNIESIVFSGTIQGSNAGSMIKRIQKAGKTSEKRAKLIARDQSSKLNSALTQQRSQNLGIEEYVWRTSEDGRVRENHKQHNGKTFRWDEPPKDTGHPGHDIQCRCVAQPIINI